MFWKTLNKQSPKWETVGAVLEEDERREDLYSEFNKLGLPTDDLYLLTNLALKQLLDLIKTSVASYKADQQ